MMRIALIALLVFAATAEAQSEPDATPSKIFPGKSREMSARKIAERDGVPVYRKELWTDVYTIDRILKSMDGPSSRHSFTLLDEKPEVVWLVGYRSTMTTPEGDTDLGPDFMCHSNLDVDDMRDHFDDFPTEQNVSTRVFTLAQGQLEVDLPEGFGIPMMSDQQMTLTAQVLNHNIADANFDVRQVIQVDFIRNRDLAKPLIPLVQIGASGLVLMDGSTGHFGLSQEELAAKQQHGPGCLPGEPEGSIANTRVDDQGQKFTMFWRVPPGRLVNHTRVTEMLKLRSDTRVHYIAVHLHPFAESVELRDVTTGESVYKSDAANAAGKIGLAALGHYSSKEGLMLHADHEYEVIDIYDNTSGELQDAMVSLFLYVHADDMYDFYFTKND